jgi:hypothetical protein
MIDIAIDEYVQTESKYPLFQYLTRPCVTCHAWSRARQLVQQVARAVIGEIV